MTDLELKLVRELADVLAKYEKFGGDIITLRKSNDAFSRELVLLGAMLHDISNAIYEKDKTQMPVLLKRVCDVFGKRSPLKGEGTFVKKVITRRDEPEDKKVLEEWAKFVQKMGDVYKGKKEKK